MLYAIIVTYTYDEYSHGDCACLWVQDYGGIFFLTLIVF